VLPSLKVSLRLRALELVSNTSYYWRRQSAISDYSSYDRAVFLGDPYPPAGEQGQGFWADDQENWTQEIRVSLDDPNAPVRWTAGAFYQHARENTVLNVFDPALARQVGFPDFNGGYIYVQDPFTGIDRQIAIFGQADLRATEKLTVTLGLRYSHTDFEAHTYYAGPVVGDPVASNGKQSERPVTPRIGISYQAGGHHLVYASAAKGYRIGGANPAVGQFCYGPGSALERIGLDNVPATYDSDSVWSYEIGSKSRFADDRVLLNASAYLIRWRQIQQNVPLTECGFQFVANLGAAESRGLDVQAVYRPSELLSLGGTFSYTDARFTRTVQLQPTVSSIVREGDHLAGSPWKLAVFGQVGVPFGNRLGYVRADYQYNARQTDLVPNQNPLNGGYALGIASVPAQSFASLRAGVQSGGLDISLFAQNLFDTRPRLTINQDVASPSGGTPLRYVITWPPRTIGLTATFRH
jgi:outer membrane receptor protein involved in Fe transport